MDSEERAQRARCRGYITTWAAAAECQAKRAAEAPTPVAAESDMVLFVVSLRLLRRAIEMAGLLGVDVTDHLDRFDAVAPVTATRNLLEHFDDYELLTDKRHDKAVGFAPYWWNNGNDGGIHAAAGHEVATADFLRLEHIAGEVIELLS